MIIAEIGQNWAGDLALAKTLIELAKECGADLVKSQLFDSKALYGEYKDTELTFEQAKELFDYGEKIGIEVFYSVFDIERVKWCEEIGVKRYKIAYSQRQNDELWEALGETGKPIIASGVLLPLVYCDAPVFPLFCSPKYPALEKDYEFLWARNWWDDMRLGTYSGVSDHTVGMSVVKMAIRLSSKLGLHILEKHFAIDHKTGVDALWSMTPSELRELKRFENVVKEFCENSHYYLC